MIFICILYFKYYINNLNIYIYLFIINLFFMINLLYDNILLIKSSINYNNYNDNKNNSNAYLLECMNIE